MCECNNNNRELIENIEELNVQLGFIDNRLKGIEEALVEIADNGIVTYEQNI